MSRELRSDRLLVFDAVVRAKSFTAAARALGTTQSNVSQTVAALEADVGEALFDRSARRAVLTEAGRTLHSHALTVLAALENARHALSGLDEVLAGTLRIGTSDTLATHVLPPVFAAFRAAHPQVELRLDNRPSPAIAQKLSQRELDIGVVSLPLPFDVEGAVALKQVPLLTQRDVVISAVGHALASRRKVTVAELAKFPLVLLDRSTGSRAWLEARFAEAKVSPKVAMEMSSLEVLKRLVELDFGVSIVPELAVRDEVAAGRLASRPLVGVEARKVGLLLPSVPTRAARAFADLAKNSLSPRGEGQGAGK